MRHVIMTRKQRLVNTDPQRRCYNGCHFSSELVWGPWEELEHIEPEGIERRLKFWRELNDYAVKERGEGARAEFVVRKKHLLFKTGDTDAPDSIKDRNGEVVLGLCRECGRGEIELREECVA